MHKIYDLTGHKFGELTVLSLSHVQEVSGRRRNTVWECICSCGNKKIVPRNYLVNRDTKSCGCLKNKKSDKPSKNQILVEYEGRRVTIAEASDLSGIPQGTIYGRIQRGKPLFKKKNKYKAGDHHYRLTLLEPVNPKRPSRDWIMRCDCGELTKAGACEVRTGKIRSCGCLLKDTMRELQLGVAKVDLTKQKFNKLRVLRQAENVSVYYAGCVWECECECGNIVNVPTSRLTTGHTKSCGCLKEATQSAEFMELIRPIAKKKYLDYQKETENA